MPEHGYTPTAFLSPGICGLRACEVPVGPDQADTGQLRVLRNTLYQRRLGAPMAARLVQMHQNWQKKEHPGS